MKKALIYVWLIVCTAASGAAQTRPRAKGATPRPAAKTHSKTLAKPLGAADTAKGVVAGRIYTNAKLGFEITFPDTWLIPGADFEDHMKSQGFDLSLRAPDSLNASGKASVNAALKRVTLLLTAYRSMPGTADNAIMRISLEDLTAAPQIKDAVDYFDAMRASFKTLKLPADFKFSETQAERLGNMQFGYLDTSTRAGKKRSYATVRRGFAVMFTLSYSSNEDLGAMRRVLEEGNFNLK